MHNFDMSKGLFKNEQDFIQIKKRMHPHLTDLSLSERAEFQGDYMAKSGDKRALGGEWPKSGPRFMILFLLSVCSTEPGVQWSS
jgi:hypothetical protein